MQARTSPASEDLFSFLTPTGKLLASYVAAGSTTSCGFEWPIVLHLDLSFSFETPLYLLVRREKNALLSDVLRLSMVHLQLLPRKSTSALQYLARSPWLSWLSSDDSVTLRS